MQTPKEIFLELLQPDGHPERILKQYEALHLCLTDPINTYLRGNRRRGTVSRDRWGTTISFPEDAPGAIPVHTDDLTVCPGCNALGGDGPRPGSGGQLHPGLGDLPHRRPLCRRGGKAPGELYGHGHF